MISVTYPHCGSEREFELKRQLILGHFCESDAFLYECNRLREMRREINVNSFSKHETDYEFENKRFAEEFAEDNLSKVGRFNHYLIFESKTNFKPNGKWIVHYYWY